ncbi:hypothetical protein [Streptomyces sp. NBC_01314]|uniref:hypothetical protein n=1 Tax=Streptomyces sp. NBC_01314 TaxID=2903821 RepID=UPI0030894E2D|nr:hypothetical protein OG622_48835 [Streptomyces sp. NBC_01314]
MDALAKVAQEKGVDSAHTEILSGTFDTLEYCIPTDCPDGSKALQYGEGRTAKGPVNLIRGSVTLGRRNGEPFIHCVTRHGSTRRVRCGQATSSSPTR